MHPEQNPLHEPHETPEMAERSAYILFQHAVMDWFKAAGGNSWQWVSEQLDPVTQKRGPSLAERFEELMSRNPDLFTHFDPKQPDHDILTVANLLGITVAKPQPHDQNLH